MGWKCREKYLFGNGYSEEDKLKEKTNVEYNR